MGEWKDGQCHLGAQEQESFIESWPNGQTLCILWGGGWTWVITPRNFGFVWCFMCTNATNASAVSANDICFQDATGVFQGYYFSGVPTQPHCCNLWDNTPAWSQKDKSLPDKILFSHCQIIPLENSFFQFLFLPSFFVIEPQISSCQNSVVITCHWWKLS